ncbi:MULTISPECIES: hypothetical protein [unclassified Empedobacter]|uniref:hypothetical protein n=2 Tax=Weeksellaceae TaxID=2762318 RepID=UPI0024496463|nr:MULTISPECIES: hypothetical protein [unclassified Empedobacter]MDH0674685.1 hypothetical protein [Empedobacter sp. GD03861]MDM1138927.1 hypothetical protein [Empedobacter sp. R132-2]
MKRILLYGCLLFSNIGFAQENLTAYYQYSTSFKDMDGGVKIVYELNQKGSEANFEIKKNDRFYDGKLYQYINYKDKISETQRNYKGKRAVIYKNYNKIDWAFKDETKVVNNCNAKRADYQFEEGNLTHTIEVWYCPSEVRFSPIVEEVNFFDIPGYVISYKETLNNKVKKVSMITEYNLLEFKENNTIQIKRPNEGERINYDLIDKGFTTSNN